LEHKADKEPRRTQRMHKSRNKLMPTESLWDKVELYFCVAVAKVIRLTPKP
jgi:hypothetical protein